MPFSSEREQLGIAPGVHIFPCVPNYLYGQAARSRLVVLFSKEFMVDLTILLLMTDSQAGVMCRLLDSMMPGFEMVLTKLSKTTSHSMNDQKYTMGDTESRRNIRAEAEACANDLRHPQNRLQDLWVFEMDIESSSGYMKVITDRSNYFKEIESDRVEGVPVTTPVRAADNTHHIVQYNDPEKKRNGNNPDDVVAVQTLYRNCDNYYTAFRPIKRSHRIEDPSGWFYFNDVKLPIFLRKNLRGETKAFKLTLSSAYKQIEDVSVGHGSTRAIFMCCSKYTQVPSNYRAISNDREKAVQSNMILMGEGQRFPEVKREVVHRMANGVLAPLQPELIKPVNQWSVISDFIFQHLLGINGVLEKVEIMFGWDLRAGGEGECRLSLLVGPEAKISLLNYHHIYARDVIKARQQGH